MKIFLVTWAMLGFMASAANAQTVDCANASTQLAMNECAERSFKAADAELNSTYKALTQKVTKPGLAKLKSAERAWIAYRDAQCAFETAGTEDGSIHPMVVSSCLEGLTRAQTKRLAGQMNCEEGDLSCGGQ
jgi:uncharacterized protein YecT (DUF1311 family)